MPDGSEVEGPADLRRSLLLRPGGFAQALTTKLMMYALGREIDPQDMPQVRAIVRAAAKDNYRFSRSWRGLYPVMHSACRRRGIKIMYLTRKHLSRRTLLKGAGVAVGLPLLDAMIPAGTALAQTAAKPKLRAGFFYMPTAPFMWNTKHGKDMDRWTPSGAGAGFQAQPNSRAAREAQTPRDVVRQSREQGQPRLRATNSTRRHGSALSSPISKAARSQHVSDDRPDHCRAHRPGDGAAVRWRSARGWS